MFILLYIDERSPAELRTLPKLTQNDSPRICRDIDGILL
jgi:hypothetical protein